MLTSLRIFWKLDLRRLVCRIVRNHKNRTIVEGRNMAHCPDCGKVLRYTMIKPPIYKWK